MGPGPTCHTLGVLVREYEEGEPTREERAATRGSTPLHLHRNQRPSLGRKGLGLRVILLGRRFLGAEKSNRRSQQYCAPSVPLQEDKKVNF
jgi:hypothetical protein